MSGTAQARILVVDDDEMILTIVRKMLEALGFSAEVSLSGPSGLALLSKSVYDAILCDMWMPGMTGKEFYQQLEEGLPQYKNRIVFITGDVASEATWDFIEEKNLPYVMKPITVAHLMQKLNQVLMAPSAPSGETAAADRRRGLRLATKASARVRSRWGKEDPEVVSIANFTREGLYFLTERDYRVGAEVLVAFPYTGINDVDQRGYVVRAAEQEDRRRGVAIAMGVSADAVRSVLSTYEKEPSRHAVQVVAEWSPEATALDSAVEETARIADLKLQVAQRRQEASFLLLDLADLKAVYERLIGQHDLAAKETRQSWELQELIAVNSAISQVIEDLKRQIQTLRDQVAAAEAEGDRRDRQSGWR